MKTVKRRVFETNADCQIELFLRDKKADEVEREEVRERVVFRTLKRTKIFIGNRRLDEHLKAAGIMGPLAIADVLEKLNWSCFEESYKGGGRPPYHPRLMMGILLYGIGQGVSSLRGLEKFARTDLGCMWVCAGIAPDHSILGRFTTKHCKLLTGDFFVSLTQEVLRVTGSNCDSVAGDGTVVASAASRFSMIKKEAAEQALKDAKIRSDAAPHDDKLQKKAGTSEKVVETLKQRSSAKKAKGREAQNTKVSQTDPDAMDQRLKNKLVRPSYKPSIMANEKRVIIAVEVDPSNEVKVVGPMLETIEKISGKQPEQCMLDAGYHCTEIIKNAYENNIDLLCPEGRLDADGKTTKQSKKKYPKSAFVYDEATNIYFCPAKKELTELGRYKGSEKYPAYAKYGTEDCKECTLRDKCTKSKIGRKITRYKEDELKDAQRHVMEQPSARKRYKKRQAWVEPVFSELKGCQGLERFRRIGIVAVTMEFFLHAMAHNLRKAAFAAAIFYNMELTIALLIQKIRLQRLNLAYMFCPSNTVATNFLLKNVLMQCFTTSSKGF